MNAPWHTGSDERDPLECVFCAEDGERVEASHDFSGAACCTECYEDLLHRAEEQEMSREQPPSYDEVRAEMDDIFRSLKS